MRIKRQPRPVLGMESRRVDGQRRLEWNRLIARKHAAAQEAVARRVGRELEVAVQVTVPNPLLESLDDVRRLGELDDASDLHARPKLQLNTGNHAEQTVAADRQAEQIGVLPARAGAHHRIGSEEIEFKHLIDDWLQIEAAAVRIAGERAGNAQSIGARLLLIDAPLPLALALLAVEEFEQLRPLNAALHGDRALLRVEV